MSVTKLYESDFATLYLGDCRDALPLIETASIGLLVTDPPYGINYESCRRNESFGPIANDDGSLDVPAVLAAYAKKLRSHRHVYVFGFKPDQLAAPMNLGGTAELVWDKGIMSMGDLSKPWGLQHEPITFGVTTKAKIDKSDGKLSARLRHGSVLRVQRKNGSGVVRHSTEKPVELLSMLIESSSMRGDIVLDPFAGSGSTLVAAILLGRRAIGMELDCPYAEKAVRRVVEAEKLAKLMRAC